LFGEVVNAVTEEDLTQLRELFGEGVNAVTEEDLTQLRELFGEGVNAVTELFADSTVTEEDWSTTREMQKKSKSDLTEDFIRLLQRLESIQLSQENGRSGDALQVAFLVRKAMNMVDDLADTQGAGQWKPFIHDALTALLTSDPGGIAALEYWKQLVSDLAALFLQAQKSDHAEVRRSQTEPARAKGEGEEERPVWKSRKETVVLEEEAAPNEHLRGWQLRRAVEVDDDLSTGAILGIVFGVLIVLVVLGWMMWKHKWCFKRIKDRRKGTVRIGGKLHMRRVTTFKT